MKVVAREKWICELCGGVFGTRYEIMLHLKEMHKIPNLKYSFGEIYSGEER
jgi:hypothetical protein